MQVTITYFWATPTALDWWGPVLLSKSRKGFLQVTSPIHCSTLGVTSPLLSRLIIIKIFQYPILKQQKTTHCMTNLLQ